MHIVKGSTDPIIVSVDGTLEVTEAIHRGIQAGEIDEEGAFARFFGLCTALSPQSSANKVFEAHEGFWAFGGAETLRTLRGGSLDGFRSNILAEFHQLCLCRCSFMQLPIPSPS
ncbi:hypothetical protein CXR23_05695 [Brevibacterium aurantiacum]|uniref:Uncharacterized protein n=1 Tax=Brevibacterium aurantiacum TaxID=273384 RepID=A0A3T0DD17_BREAU|nr:hypothetical protein CXR23_05695 [Brevibacterium aurantiacum]